MTTAYVVVSGNFARGHTLYGPFDSVERAQAWAGHEHRAEETRAEFRVVPLFGGIGVSDEPVEAEGGVIVFEPGTVWIDAETGEFERRDEPSHWCDKHGYVLPQDGGGCRLCDEAVAS